VVARQRGGVAAVSDTDITKGFLDTSGD